MNKEKVLWCFSLAAGVLVSIAFFCHIVVLWLLRRVARGQTNQKLLIMNLILTEIVFIPAGIVYYFPIPGRIHGTLRYEMSGLAFSALAINCYLATAFMIVDRTIAGIIPLRYRSVVTAKRAKRASIVIWVPSLCCPLFYFLLKYENYVKLMILVTIVLDMIMLVLTFIGYGFIYMALRRRSRTFKWKQGDSNQAKMASKQQAKVFKVAAPIIITFFVFAVLPDVIALVLSLKNIDPVFYRKLFYAFPSVNILLDPLISLYQYPPLRKEFFRQFGVGGNGRPYGRNERRKGAANYQNSSMADTASTSRRTTSVTIETEQRKSIGVSSSTLSNSKADLAAASAVGLRPEDALKHVKHGSSLKRSSSDCSSRSIVTLGRDCTSTLSINSRSSLNPADGMTAKENEIAVVAVQCNTTSVNEDPNCRAQNLNASLSKSCCDMDASLKQEEIADKRLVQKAESNIECNVDNKQLNASYAAEMSESNGNISNPHSSSNSEASHPEGGGELLLNTVHLQEGSIEEGTDDVLMHDMSRNRELSRENEMTISETEEAPTENNNLEENKEIDDGQIWVSETTANAEKSISKIKRGSSSSKRGKVKFILATCAEGCLNKKTESTRF